MSTEFVIDTRRGSSDLTDAIDKLDKARMTRKAWRPRARPLITAVLADTGYLNELNAASHGDWAALDTTHAHLADRIEQTERLCTDLLGTTSP